MTKPDPVAVSPGVGPLPPIYVPPPGQPGPVGLFCRAVARAAHLAGGRATRRLPPRRHDVRHPR